MVGAQDEAVCAGEEGGPGAPLDEPVGEQDGAGQEEDALEQPHWDKTFNIKKENK